MSALSRIPFRKKGSHSTSSAIMGSLNKKWLNCRMDRHQSEIDSNTESREILTRQFPVELSGKPVFLLFFYFRLIINLLIYYLYLLTNLLVISSSRRRGGE